MSVAATSPVLSKSESFTSELEEKIRFRAYELYLLRGRTPGDAVQDWLRAEAEVIAEFPLSAPIAEQKSRQPRKRQSSASTLKKKKSS